MTYLQFFLAALFLANGVPHFVKGIIGEKHMTPFGKPSGAVVNVLWGGLNFYVGFWFVRWALEKHYDLTLASLVVIAGIVLMGLVGALIWQNDPKARGKK